MSVSSDSSVSSVRHTPRKLAESVSPVVADLARAALVRPIVIYAGAGLSVAPPACGPPGWLVAKRLRPSVAKMLNVDETSLSSLTLEELSQRVSDRAPAQMGQLRELASKVFDFCGLEPNYGHEAVALLLREGIFQVVTANWDCAIERAGLRAAVHIVGVATAAELLRLRRELPLYKVHGCATRPDTLALTQDEVNRPQRWAVAQVESALTAGHVVFLGLGTVGLYVSEPIEDVVDLWGSEATVHVVDPVLSPAWASALEGRADQTYYASTADDFLDELLRAVVEQALWEVEQSSRVLAETDVWANAMVEGVGAVVAASKNVSADAFLRWWRDGVAETEAGETFMVALRGRQALMTVGLLVGQGSAAATCDGARGRMTLCDSGSYYEVTCRPGAHISDVERVTRARIEERSEGGVYSDLRPVTVVVVESVGEVPAWEAPDDIAGTEGDPNDISGSARPPIRFVAAEDGVRGHLSA